MTPLRLLAAGALAASAAAQTQCAQPIPTAIQPETARHFDDGDFVTLNFNPKTPVRLARFAFSRPGGCPLQLAFALRVCLGVNRPPIGR